MRAPEFWRQDGARWPARLLAPLGWIYGQLTLARLRRPGLRAPIPVLSIGNFTAGGAGKTPTAIALAEALIKRGERPAFVTRGHGGSEVGPCRVDAARHEFNAVGDEALLLARIAPTIVSRNRAQALALAIDAGASCLILDDALQNPQLAKDFSLAVIDGAFGFGNGECLPAGPLRAPIRPILAHVDAVLLIGSDDSGAVAAMPASLPVHLGGMGLLPGAEARLRGAPLVAFAGIGRPEKFRATLAAAGGRIAAFRAFGDHHPFSEAEAAALLAEAERLGAVLVTTEKDFVRLTGGAAREALAKAAFPVPITVNLPEALAEAVYSALVSARRRLSTASGPA